MKNKSIITRSIVNNFGAILAIYINFSLIVGGPLTPDLPKESHPTSFLSYSTCSITYYCLYTGLQISPYALTPKSATARQLVGHSYWLISSTTYRTSEQQSRHVGLGVLFYQPVVSRHPLRVRDDVTLGGCDGYTMTTMM